MASRFAVSLITLILAVLTVTESASAAPLSAPKSFAVFVAFYNAHGGEVRGGVCGTVFFVSPTQAITAHHVLRAESFKPIAGFERVRVWLIHEDSAPIEMKPEYVSSNSEKDVSLIRLPESQKVDAKFIFPTAPVTTVTSDVETDGFVANTAGPTLVREGEDVTIAKVSNLSRLHLQGKLLRSAIVNLKASDIDLKASPNVELSYQPVVGISGGPVTADGKVIAMNSFADPRTRKSTWALRLLNPPAPLAAKTP
jgi:hypothetical protein